jgi:hypothetical protein
MEDPKVVRDGDRELVNSGGFSSANFARLDTAPVDSSVRPHRYAEIVPEKEYRPADAPCRLMAVLAADTGVW